MRALVTGATGFVGTHLVKALNAHGHDTYSTDIRLDGFDLAVPGLAARLFEWEPDVVFHLASSCSSPGSITNPMRTFHDTVVTAVEVLDAARENKTPVILTSSVKARDGETPYGASKVMVETWAREYRRCYDVPLVINRPGTIYGPGQEGSDESGWIAWFCEARDKGLTITINGDGEQTRDLLHVDDYVRLMIAQAQHLDEYEGKLYDVGGGVENTVTVNQIARHLGLKTEHGPARSGDARSYVGYNGLEHWKPEIRWWESETLA